jgi:hypothetical protein
VCISDKSDLIDRLIYRRSILDYSNKLSTFRDGDVYFCTFLIKFYQNFVILSINLILLYLTRVFMIKETFNLKYFAFPGLEPGSSARRASSTSPKGGGSYNFRVLSPDIF